jgi:hypothetical protein
LIISLWQLGQTSKFLQPLSAYQSLYCLVNFRRGQDGRFGTTVGEELEEVLELSGSERNEVVRFKGGPL